MNENSCTFFCVISAVHSHFHKSINSNLDWKCFSFLIKLLKEISNVIQRTLNSYVHFCMISYKICVLRKSKAGNVTNSKSQFNYQAEEIMWKFN